MLKSWPNMVHYQQNTKARRLPLSDPFCIQSLTSAGTGWIYFGDIFFPVASICVNSFCWQQVHSPFPGSLQDASQHRHQHLLEQRSPDVLQSRSQQPEGRPVSILLLKRKRCVYFTGYTLEATSFIIKEEHLKQNPVWSVAKVDFSR